MLTGCGLLWYNMTWEDSRTRLAQGLVGLIVMFWGAAGVALTLRASSCGRDEPPSEAAAAAAAQVAEQSIWASYGSGAMDATEMPASRAPQQGAYAVPPPSSGQLATFGAWEGADMEAVGDGAPPGLPLPPAFLSSPVWRPGQPGGLGPTSLISELPRFGQVPAAFAPMTQVPVDAPSAKVVREALVQAFSQAHSDPFWARRFWTYVGGLEIGGALTAGTTAVLRAFGYIGGTTVTPPKADALEKSLKELEIKATLAQAPGVEAQCCTPLQGLKVQGVAPRWARALPPDFRRAAPEIYRSIRASGKLSVKEWVSDEYKGNRDTDPSWRLLWSSAVQIDFALASCTSEAALIQALETDDRLEISLRELSAHFFEARSKDSCAAQVIRGVATPGRSNEITPSWLLTEATVRSKQEHQRDDRTKWKMKKGKGKENGGEQEECLSARLPHHPREEKTRSAWVPKTSCAFPAPPSWQGVDSPIQKLFPVPLPPRPRCNSTSHRVRQRHTHKLSRWSASTALLRALNSTYGGIRADSCSRQKASSVTTAAQRSTISWARAVAEPLLGERRESTLSGAHAVSRLCKSNPDSDYFTRPSHAQVPFVAEFMDEPSYSQTVSMLEALPPIEAQYYSDEANVINASGTSAEQMRELEEQYAFLGGTEDEWVAYLHRPLPPQMWTYLPAEDVKAIGGVSAVPKKKPPMLRKLIMCVSCNFAWEDVSKRVSSGMGGGLSLTSMRTRGDEINFSSLDESNAFTSVLTPAWMWPWMCCPPVRAGRIWSLLPEALRNRVSPGSWVYPAYQRLPMGSAHAVHILLAINIRAIGMALWATSKLSQKAAPPVAASAPRVIRQVAPRSKPRTVQALKDWISRWGPSPESGLRTIRILLVMFGPLPVKGMETILRQLQNELNLRLAWAFVDLENGWDLTDPQVMALLLEMIREGAIDCVIAMPPQCRGAANALLWMHCLALLEGVEMRGGCSVLLAATDTLIKLDPVVRTKLGSWSSDRNLSKVEASLCRFAACAAEEFYLIGNLPSLETLSLLCDHSPCFPDPRRLRSMPWRLARSLLALVCAEAQAMLSRGHGPGGWMKGTRQSRRPPTCSWPSSQDQIGHSSLNDAFAKGCLVELSASSAASYVHVDDGIFFSCDSEKSERPKCDDSLRASVQQLEWLGFVVGEARVSMHPAEKLVGYQVIRSPPAIRLPSAKMVLLRTALLWLAHRPHIQANALRSVVGVWLWGALLARYWLAVPMAVFTFCTRFEGRTVRPWPSVRRELLVMAQAVLCFTRELNRPVAPWLLATDAEGINHDDAGGFGVTYAWAGSDLAFKTLLNGTRGGRTVVSLDGDVNKLKRPEAELRARYAVSRLPMEIFDLEWYPLLHARYRFPEHITVYEARASVIPLEMMAATEGCHGWEISSLMDNEPWSGAAAKGRSPSPQLSPILRRKAALQAAAQLECHLPWTDTHHQPADFYSRIH